MTSRPLQLRHYFIHIYYMVISHVAKSINGLLGILVKNSVNQKKVTESKGQFLTQREQERGFIIKILNTSKKQTKCAMAGSQSSSSGQRLELTFERTDLCLQVLKRSLIHGPLSPETKQLHPGKHGLSLQTTSFSPKGLNQVFPQQQIKKKKCTLTPYLFPTRPMTPEIADYKS